MHQTTLRFGEDLWQLIDAEAERLGMSVAQYVRESALARAAYDSGRRGDPSFEIALQRAGAAPAEMSPQTDVESEPGMLGSRAERAEVELAREPSYDSPRSGRGTKDQEGAKSR